MVNIVYYVRYRTLHLFLWNYWRIIMKQYRNAIRSQNLLKKALLDLLKEMDISKVTVKMVCDKSDLSRNTFYHHYADVYDILEEVQKELEEKCISSLDSVMQSESLGQVHSFFKTIFDFVSENLDSIKAILQNDNGGRFVERIKVVMIKRALRDNEAFHIKDERGYVIFLGIIFSGVLDLIKQYIYHKTDLTKDEIADEAYKIFMAGYNIYAD